MMMVVDLDGAHMDFEEIDPDLRKLLYAGEIMHIGKNTRFGFGRYTMVEP